jgi:two-component system, response regulator PdtaR
MPSRTPRKYLIVDDNAAFAENLAEIITDAGGEAAIAHSGDRALALAERTRFDALVSDMRMPVMGGAELVHRVRAIDPGLPAIVVTAYIADNELETARQEGLLGIFGKPVPLDRLMALLRGARRDAVVAIVEDDAALADNLTEALRSRGFSAVTASSVADTERLGVRPFCALVDLRLPGGPDGAAMGRLRAKYPELPMLVITALATEPPPPSAGHFAKPFDTGALLDAVERLYASGRG